MPPVSAKNCLLPLQSLWKLEKLIRVLDITYMYSHRSILHSQKATCNLPLFANHYTLFVINVTSICQRAALFLICSFQTLRLCSAIVFHIHLKMNLLFGAVHILRTCFLDLFLPTHPPCTPIVLQWETHPLVYVLHRLTHPPQKVFKNALQLDCTAEIFL